MSQFDVDWFRSLKPQQQAAVLSEIDKFTDDEVLALSYDWSFWARPSQWQPGGDWFTWLILAGRGWGKTRVGAEWVKQRVESGTGRRIALIGDTAADVRDVMVEGSSGILSVSHPKLKPTYEPSKRRLSWPNGAIAICYAAESPESLRGPQHDTIWADEPAKWKNLRKRDVEGGTAWDNAMMGLRTGEKPQCCATTTPRSIKWLTDLMAKDSTVITRGSSYENRENLSQTWFEQVIKPYEGTRLGRQEINAEVLGDTEGALWKRQVVDDLRVDTAPDLVRVVVALDPSVTSTEASDECGIVVAGRSGDGHCYVLNDSSLVSSPNVWASKAVQAFHAHKGDLIVGEANNGGDLVELVVRTVEQSVPFKKVHASRGKYTRAEPVAALYEQKLVHHVGSFPALEDEMCSWVPGEKSPNRMDALVWAITELMLSTKLSVLFEV